MPKSTKHTHQRDQQVLATLLVNRISATRTHCQGRHAEPFHYSGHSQHEQEAAGFFAVKLTGHATPYISPPAAALQEHRPSRTYSVQARRPVPCKPQSQRSMHAGKFPVGPAPSMPMCRAQRHLLRRPGADRDDAAGASANQRAPRVLRAVGLRRVRRGRAKSAASRGDTPSPISDRPGHQIAILGGGQGPCEALLSLISRYRSRSGRRSIDDFNGIYCSPPLLPAQIPDVEDGVGALKCKVPYLALKGQGEATRGLGGGVLEEAWKTPIPDGADPRPMSSFRPARSAMSSNALVC
ncbi:hypothetical protein GQ53DRAFT_811833 [Thozetella sp. PMI_491]|nr:hypothetical protein GQ53DRAFT_811833 [Thozetella sp. PMI_491]